ncbi:MAG: DUF3990 domain-containing protein [Clostridiales Family XIII bacterium]|nr:DUF3990 domain-containing protein [Clostridiales Family XIII bacterium]
MSDTKIITLYHGSINIIDNNDITKGKPYKDFGMGFYTSESIAQATNLALRNKDIEEFRLRNTGKDEDVKAWLYKYTFDLSTLDDLSVKNFETADKEWIRFVLLNRQSSKNEHNYDVVIGPTANDNTRVTIRAFFAGAYGEIDGDDAIDKLIEMIEPERLPSQFFFGSERATKNLKLVERQLII